MESQSAPYKIFFNKGLDAYKIYIKKQSIYKSKRFSSEEESWRLLLSDFNLLQICSHLNSIVLVAK
jgi:hypothetical protein